MFGPSVREEARFPLHFVSPFFPLLERFPLTLSHLFVGKNSPSPPVEDLGKLIVVGGRLVLLCLIWIFRTRYFQEDLLGRLLSRQD